VASSEAQKAYARAHYARNREKRLAWQAAYRAANPGQVRATQRNNYAKNRAERLEYARSRARTTAEQRLQDRYGIGFEGLSALYAAQNGRCAICATEAPMRGRGCFHVDHCHESGRVRGLLCGSCNKALGLFKDNTLRLSSAIAYLSAT
jgi:hypothetical protein